MIGVPINLWFKSWYIYQEHHERPTKRLGLLGHNNFLSNDSLHWSTSRSVGMPMINCWALNRVKVLHSKDNYGKSARSTAIDQVNSSQLSIIM
jgi:hypothetical protein